MLKAFLITVFAILLLAVGYFLFVRSALLYDESLAFSVNKVTYLDSLSRTT